MIVDLRALIFAFLLSLLSVPAAMAVGLPCYDVRGCQPPDPFTKPNPMYDSYQMQEDEPPGTEEEEEDEPPCNEYVIAGLGAAMILIGGAVFASGGTAAVLVGLGIAASGGAIGLHSTKDPCKTDSG